MNNRNLQRIVLALLASLIPGLTASAQRSVAPDRPLPTNVIVPQTRVFPMHGRAVVRIAKVDVEIEIADQVATTTLDIHLENPSNQRLESEILLPVPDGAAVRKFSFRGAGDDVAAQLLPVDEARRIYREIVSRLRDPALLEFAGYNLVRSSVFPVEPHGEQKVQLVYEHLLPSEGDRVDYVLPRSENVDYRVPWNVRARVRARHPISTVYSPSHDVATDRKSDDEAVVTIKEKASTEPGPFRLSFLMERDGLTASLFAYPDKEVGGGYFLLLVGAPARPTEEQGASPIKREVTIVFDRSGSMNGEKLKQVREAAYQVLAGLEDGEAFNLFVYNEGIDQFAAEPVLKSESTVEDARAYLKGVKARGGTNIHGALSKALEQKPTEGMLPIILFLTDGLPTIGQTSEAVIRELAEKHNPHKRRVFTFGVGVDVNTPLLSQVAASSRATATFVLPKEDVELKVAQVFKRLSGPVLADPELAVVGANGRPDPGRTRDVLPLLVPDLFEDDQLVVLGQYTGEKPLRFRLAGNYMGKERTFQFNFDLDKATCENTFVPRLWASRKIAFLLEAIRKMGGNGGPTPSTPPTDPRIKELVDEVVRLSTEFGILTEYTAFLAREGTDLAQPEAVLDEAVGIAGERAMRVRSGLGSVNQDMNIEAGKAAPKLNIRNTYVDKELNRVEVVGVQQVSDRAFYKRGGRWVDSRLVKKQHQAPDKTVLFGSDEFFELLKELVSANRQGVLALQGEVLVEVDGDTVLIKAQ